MCWNILENLMFYLCLLHTSTNARIEFSFWCRLLLWQGCNFLLLYFMNHNWTHIFQVLLALSFLLEIIWDSIVVIYERAEPPAPSPFRSIMIWCTKLSLFQWLHDSFKAIKHKNKHWWYCMSHYVWKNLVSRITSIKHLTKN